MMDIKKCETCGAELTDSHQCSPAAAPPPPIVQPALPGPPGNDMPAPGSLPPAGPLDGKDNVLKGRSPLPGNGEKIDANAVLNGNQIGMAVVMVAGGSELKATLGKDVKENEDKYNASTTINSLFDWTEPLGMEPYQLPDDIAQSVDHYLSVIRKKFFLIVSSLDSGPSYFAARKLVDGFQIPDDERRRTLDFNRTRDERISIDIDSLFGKSDKDVPGHTAVIIRCTTSQSARFLDSLFKQDESDFYELRGKLRKRGVYLICLIPSSELARRKISLKREMLFDVWHIDRLGTLLEKYYSNTSDSIRERLLGQREYELWSGGEQEFYDQVKTALENGTLLQKLKANQLEVEKKSAACVIPEDEPLKQTVYYVATFFPGLSPNDFNKVVQALLGGRTMTISKTIDQQAEDGTTRQVTVSVEKPLRDLWRESSDRILRECNLVAIRRESTVIAFSKEWMQSDFKKVLEENYSLYLDNQFEIIQSTGLLFSPSVKVADNVIALIVDRILTFPDVYDSAWLFNLIRVVNASIEEINKLPWVSDIVRFLHAKTKYRRLSELIRKMPRNPLLTRMVNGLLEGLIAIGGHGSVFEIVKNLRYAPDFNDYHWLRQLLEQGDGETAESVLQYLYSEMKRLNHRVYEVLHALDAWLPDPNQTNKGYSISGRAPLELLVEYYEYSMRAVTFDNHGQWPTTYSLLFARNIKTARDNLGLLIRWFFHPWMKDVLANRAGENEEDEPEVYYYTGSFVVGLSLILLNSPDRDWDRAPSDHSQPPPLKSSDEPDSKTILSEAEAQPLCPDDLFEILLQELVKAAEELKQRTVYVELANCWRDYKSLFIHLINQTGYKQPDIRGRLIGAYKTVLHLEAEFNRLRVEAVS